MANQGDDCYFYYYSTCTKGDTCPFRHCDAAMGNETVCNLWQEGRCFRTVCKFRHMEITKKRKEIPCYWENHPAGCQKPHCAFYHEKPRLIDGIFFPPDKSLSKSEEQLQEEPAPPPATPLPTAANPQLRGVKTETQEPVPSPTHPPVVINPADDDEDEDDQFSEEGEDGKVGPSPRKLPKSDDSLNFGVSTLEEIRLRKALKASMRKSDVPLQCADTSSNGEKENILSFFAQPVHQESGRSRGSVADRLGRRMPNIIRGGEDVPLKRSLAERLGGLMDEDESPAPPLRGLRSIKDRLETPAGPIAASPGAETSLGSKKPAETIRIKTLEEIRKEKAAKSQNNKDPLQGVPETTATKRAPPKDAKSADGTSVKTFSEVLLAKKRAAGKLGEKPNTAGPDPEPAKAAEVRVKTLEEIRKEKAARTQAPPAVDSTNKRNCKENVEENGAKKPRLLRVKKGTSQTGDSPSEKSSEEAEKPEKAAPPAGSGPTAGGKIKVKTFEEIMREKRLRHQDMASSTSQATPLAEAEPSLKPSAGCNLKKRVTTKLSQTPPESPLPATGTQVSDESPPGQRISARKLMPPRTKAAAPLKSSADADVDATTVAAITAVTSVATGWSLSPRQGETHPPSAAKEGVATGQSGDSTAAPPNKRARAAPLAPAVEGSAERSLNQQEKSPEHTTDTKGRPKLNVKPSVMKPAVQLKPGQKRRGGGRSAVAAVRPLSSAPAVLEEPLQETEQRDKQAFLSSSPEARLSPGVPISPSSTLRSSSTPLTEDQQPAPCFRQNPNRDTQLAAGAAARATSVPQSPTLKSPSQTKPRKHSVGASRTICSSSAAASTSAVDDFEELMNEFADDHLEEDVDPGIGEDDLLQELSDMIDS